MQGEDEAFGPTAIRGGQARGYVSITTGQDWQMQKLEFKRDDDTGWRYVAWNLPTDLYETKEYAIAAALAWAENQIALVPGM